MDNSSVGIIQKFMHKKLVSVFDNVSPKYALFTSQI